jgi:hypothetical protein
MIFTIIKTEYSSLEYDVIIIEKKVIKVKRLYSRMVLNKFTMDIHLNS